MKTKKAATKPKKVSKKLHITKRSLMAFGVVGLIVLSTFGLLYNNMFKAKAALFQVYSNNGMRVELCRTGLSGVLSSYSAIKVRVSNGSNTSMQWKLGAGMGSFSSGTVGRFNSTSILSYSIPNASYPYVELSITNQGMTGVSYPTIVKKWNLTSMPGPC